MACSTINALSLPLWSTLRSLFFEGPLRIDTSAMTRLIVTRVLRPDTSSSGPTSADWTGPIRSRPVSTKKTSTTRPFWGRTPSAPAHSSPGPFDRSKLQSGRQRLTKRARCEPILSKPSPVLQKFAATSLLPCSSLRRWVKKHLKVKLLNDQTFLAFRKLVGEKEWLDYLHVRTFISKAGIQIGWVLKVGSVMLKKMLSTFSEKPFVI